MPTINLTETQISELIEKMGDRLTISKARIDALSPSPAPRSIPTLPSASQGAKKPRKQKFNNRVVHWDGLRFDSQGERDRWITLLRLQALGKIRGLERQVKFPLLVNGHLISLYTADFAYYEIDSEGQEIYVVEDYKSPITAAQRDYIIRKKLLKALYGHTIKETMKG